MAFRIARTAARLPLRAQRGFAPTLSHARSLNIHEYQSANLMVKHGVNVPFGIAVSTVDEAVAAAEEIGDEEVVIKSQILAGGRGLGTFTNGEMTNRMSQGPPHTASPPPTTAAAT